MNMNNQLLHTPEGVRDIYAEEYARKLAVEQKIQHVFSLYGYQSIETPVFEFFDIFKKERGSVGSQGMYKFFDRDNNTLVLRPDMTLLAVWQNIIWMKPNPYVSAILDQPSLTVPAIRGA